ncbi:MAG: hypothetical protein R3B47_20755 [Bacteroidia bacterium]
MTRKNIITIIAALLCGTQWALAQDGTVRGRIKDEINRPVGEVKLEVLDSGGLTRYADKEGNYEVKLPSGRIWQIRFTHPAFDTTVLELRVLPGYVHNEPIIMRDKTLGQQVIQGRQEITDFSRNEQMEILPIKPEDAARIPMATSIERVVALYSGGNSNEFSSQYRVRGGSFDENLVYVNGIEIYRPFLARNGQQEGLGFTNSSLADEVYFSTGGFGARFGDKMSSVLDVTYRTPNRFRGTIEAGLLTTNLHLEGIAQREKAKQEGYRPGAFTWLMGARRYSWSYLLNSLETTGDYRPNFYDLQSMFTWTPKSKVKGESFKVKERGNGRLDTVYTTLSPVKLSAFFTAARNNYKFTPRAASTTFGTIQQAFRLRTGFAGEEYTRYTTGQGALMLTVQPTTRFKMDYTLSAFRTEEAELFDVEGGYVLGEVNTNFGSDEFGESEFDLGVGSIYRHARNYLSATVLSAQARYEFTLDKNSTHKIYAGARYVWQNIDDDLKEYNGLDSAGYFVDQTGRFGIEEYIRGQANLKSNQFKAYLQHRWRLGKAATLNTGIRAYHYDLTDETLLSPRIQLSYDFSRLPNGADVRLRLAGGIYYQPPFYREFRRLDGTLNLDIKSQKAMHAIAGVDYQFEGWGRPFRFFGELYFKKLDNLIPFEMQNIRLRYYPDDIATGYAYGLDARVHGQFIKGVDSWVSVNLLKTQEDVVGDSLLLSTGEKQAVGYIPRPTDQRLAVSVYFQDELPLNPTYKVHLNYVFNSGIRFGPPETFPYRTAFSMPSYQRVDLGFSKIFIVNGGSADRGIESIWATLEIFNAFQRANTVSYIWIKDLENRQFAVPNNLSARLLNFRVIVKFR